MPMKMNMNGKKMGKMMKGGMYDGPKPALMGIKLPPVKTTGNTIKRSK